MKAHLEFNLDDPDDAERYRRVNAADNLCSAIRDFENWMREQYKYGGTGDWSSIGDRIRKRFYEMLDENGVDMEDIYS